VTRGAGGATRFRIPGTLIPAPAGAPEASQRSLLGAVTRRVLKVLVYPLTDPVFGALGDAIASRWEQAKRPYRLRAFTPAAFDAAGAAPLASADVAAMAAAGPVLLFVHGTFSTSHGAFAGLPRAVMAQLHERYGGRVMAFDHPTLSEDPPSNVRWLLSRLPAQPIELDIVCHSRGGLVSRLLSEQPAHFGLDAAHVKVRRIVLAGVPNGGTLLADPDHMVHMIDRLTTVLAMIPDGGAAEFLEALVTAVKVIGRGALKGLDGLACMRPAGDFLSVLNAPGGAAAEYFSVASDYEPADRGLRGLVAGVADNVADQVFGNAANDLVVPMAGVHELDGHAGFPVDAARRLQFGRELGVAHTGLFAQPMLSRSLVEWLS
jgi:hypothetical protein